jgi:hypothetical protein
MAVRPAVGIENAQDTIRIGEREAAEINGVYEAENGNVSAQAES